MRFANIVTILSVALAAASGGAVAQEPPPPAREAQALPIKPDPSTLKKPVTKRRSAQQRIERMPTPPPIVTDGYRPTLNPRAPSLAGQPVPALPLPSPPMPSQVNSCDSGGCTDTSGARYTGGVGNTVLDQNGRSCVRTGTTVQCF